MLQLSVVILLLLPVWFLLLLHWGEWWCAINCDSCLGVVHSCSGGVEACGRIKWWLKGCWCYASSSHIYSAMPISTRHHVLNVSAGALVLRWRYSNVDTHAIWALSCCVCFMQVAVSQIAWSKVVAGAEQLGQGKVVITNRLHASIMSNLIGRPTIYMDTKQKKVSGKCLDFQVVWMSGGGQCLQRGAGASSIIMCLGLLGSYLSVARCYSIARLVNMSPPPNRCNAAGALCPGNRRLSLSLCHSLSAALSFNWVGTKATSSV
jgi:hypothetical protein